MGRIEKISIVLSLTAILSACSLSDGLNAYRTSRNLEGVNGEMVSRELNIDLRSMLRGETNRGGRLYSGP